MILSLLLGSAVGPAPLSLVVRPSELKAVSQHMIHMPARELRPFLSACWTYLLMLTYEIDAETLHPRVPAGTELDLWNGQALVSVVAFRFTHTRVLGMPIPFHRDFDEVNLRFYVRRYVRGSGERGWRLSGKWCRGGRSL
jgi:uncharacterized protein YqjF (DUF2071 family)